MATKLKKKSKKSVTKSNKVENDGGAMSDKRFEHIAWDPKFRKMRQNVSKVQVDERFGSMFTEDKFTLKYTTDKRGRRLHHDTTDELKRYYQLEDDGKAVVNAKEEQASAEQAESSSADDKDDIDNDDDEGEIKLDLARGEGNISSSDESDSEWSIMGDETGIPGLEHAWGELDADARRVEQPTDSCRLAVMNMDWDRVRAKDLYVLLDSFRPKHAGAIESVTIYVSVFGKDRLAKEAKEGPAQFLNFGDEGVEENKYSDESEGSDSDDDVEDLDDDGNKTKKNRKRDPDEMTKPVGELKPGTTLEDNDNTRASRAQMERIRIYQLERLKYYYAIVVTDTSQTAEHLYAQCDGIEYEDTATRLDLRFVDPSTIFTECEVRETYAPSKNPNSNLLLESKYEPLRFSTAALQQTNVQLTWDERDPRRTQIVNDVFAKLSGNSIKSQKNVDEKERLRPLEKALHEMIASASESENDQDDADTRRRVLLAGTDLMDVYKAKGARQAGDGKVAALQKISVSWQSGFGEPDEPSPNTDDFDDDADEVDGNKKQGQKKRMVKRKKKQKQHVDDESKYDDVSKSAELEMLLGRHKKDDTDSDAGFVETAMTKNKAKLAKRRKTTKSAALISDFTVDPSDKRFTALYDNAMFSIDPSNPQYKATEGMERLVNERITKRAEKIDSRKPPSVSIGDMNRESKSYGNATTESKSSTEALIKSLSRKTAEIDKQKRVTKFRRVR